MGNETLLADVLPETMLAAILVELGKPLVLARVAPPRTLAAGQVLVQLAYSGICGSQLGEIRGVKGEDKYLPHLLGHEGSGYVRAVGPGVRHVRPGEKVVLHWRKGRGIESEPPTYRWEGRRVNAGWVTSFNEYAVVSENRCTPLPDDAPLDVAALFGCAVTTGFGVVENNAKVRIGESVAVFGAGGVGLNIVQAAALVSAYPLIAVDLHDNRLEKAALMGATHRLRNDGQAEARIRDIVGPGGLDVFIDNTGRPEIVEMGYRLTGPKGRVVMVGVPPRGETLSLYGLPLFFGKVLTGSHGGECAPSEDIPRLFNLYRHGRLALDALVSDRFPLERINEALDGMRDGSVAGRCLIAF